MKINGITTNISVRFQVITAMLSYDNKSIEVGFVNNQLFHFKLEGLSKKTLQMPIRYDMYSLFNKSPTYVGHGEDTLIYLIFIYFISPIPL